MDERKTVVSDKGFMIFLKFKLHFANTTRWNAKRKTVLYEVK